MIDTTTELYTLFELKARVSTLQDRYRRLMLVSLCMGFVLGMLFMAVIRFAEGAIR